MKKENQIVGNKVSVNPLESIENLILNIRGKQVMLDRDLARLYGVETKVLNQAVKRNIERFPEDFMFQLNKEEFENWKSQFVTSNWMSQNATSNSVIMGARKLPYAFTENGIAMLSGLLNSQIAIRVNIQIMRAFVAMRHSISSNQQIINRFENIEHHQLLMIERQDKTDTQIEQIFKTLANYKLPTEGVFHNGQIFDAYKFATDLIKSAKKSLVLIDNYVDESVLLMLSKRNQGVTAKIYTSQITPQLRQDLARHHSQYPTIQLIKHTTSHDRFLIIDNTEVYHIGASLKDLGKKLFAFSKLNIEPSAII